MQDPQYPLNVIAGQWNLVVTGAMSGTIHRKTNCLYFQTYRLTTGSVLPTPTTLDEGVQMFMEKVYEEFGSDDPIDIYVWPLIDGALRIDQ